MILTEKQASSISETAEFLYNRCGVSSVCDYANFLELPYKRCEQCDEQMPSISTKDDCTCLVCGSIIKSNN